MIFLRLFVQVLNLTEEARAVKNKTGFLKIDFYGAKSGLPAKLAD